ncbi:MAG: ornithine cyclodeaminase family protein [Betaproteobacteria bacterium]|nr:ornithine cyclodeaminase family protein [Betaproteobacteria bacterium]
MTDSVLLLDNEAVQGVFDVEACLKALEQAYRAHAAGRAVVRQRTQSYVPLGEPDTFYCLKTMEGALFDGNYMALRITSDIVSEAKVDGVPRREKLPRGPGETYCGLVMLFDLRRLAPVAIIHDGYIQIYRVACTSALSARLLAREGAGDLGLIGSSGQAWAHLAAMNAVMPLRRVRVYSPTPANRESFARRAHEELGIAVSAVGSAREAIEGADLVVLATNTSRPIIEGAWLKPGVHVVSIVSGDDKCRRRELDDDTMRRAALVVAHSTEAAQAQKHGDLWEPVQAGILRWEDIHDLSDVVAGTAPVRARDEDITVFKNNVGLGLQFAAVAPLVYERARAAGAGRELPASWFLEKMKA